MNEPQYGPPEGEPIQLPPPVNQKRKLWPWLTGGLVFLLVAFAGCSFFGYRLLKSPVGTGTLFAAALQEEEYAMAYDSLCDQSKDEITLEEFKTNHVPEQEIASVEPVTVSLRGSGDTDEYVVVFVLEDGSRETVEYPLLKEDGDWHVCMPPKL